MHHYTQVNSTHTTVASHATHMSHKQTIQETKLNLVLGSLVFGQQGLSEEIESQSFVVYWKLFEPKAPRQQLVNK